MKNNLQNLTLLLLLAFGLMSCGSSKLTINGDISGAENMNVFLDKYDPVTNSAQVLETSKTDDRGNFELPLAKDTESGVYRIRVGAESVFLVLEAPVQNIEVKADLDRLERFYYQVNGSELTQKFEKIMDAFVRKEIRNNELLTLVNEGPDPLVCYLIATISMRSASFLSTHQAVLTKLKAQYPNADFIRSYEGYVGELEAQYAAQNVNSKIRVGQPAPDIVMAGLDGKERKLSDLKGQVVLLDFWASWCGPCRKANPHVVETYNKYKDKGFTVFSVSLDGVENRSRQNMAPDQLQAQLDNSKQRWIAAIEKDQLGWKNHVSDLMKWDNKGAGLYGVRSIPQTFLIDREGKIAAINPRYDLEDQLVKFL